MPIVIDGWNLIRNKKSDIDDDEGDAIESANALIGYLKNFQKTHPDPILIVFDSSNEFLGMEHKNTPALRIVPAKNADNYIKRHIDAVPEKQRKNIRVVSSDNDVYYYARSAGAAPVRCEEFWGKLRSAVGA